MIHGDDDLHDCDHVNEDFLVLLPIHIYQVKYAQTNLLTKHLKQNIFQFNLSYDSVYF